MIFLMKQKLLICVFMFFCLNSFVFSSEDVLEGYFKRDCEIQTYDQKFKKVFPGRMCLFLEDGRLISADRESLSMYDKNQTLLWRLKGYFHHQLNLTNNKEFILALVYDKHSSLADTATDHFLKIDMNGKIVSSQTSEILFKNKNIDFQPWSMNPAYHKFGFKYETSHFNSIHEVPLNERSGEGGVYAPGAIIVNSLKAGYFVLSEDLKSILGHGVIDNTDGHNVHDVQILKTGDLLLYINRNTDDPVGFYSSIEIRKFDSKEVVYRYTSKSKQSFFAPAMGGVQMLNSNTILFSHSYTGVYIVDIKLDKIISFNPFFSTGSHAGDLYVIQEVKKIDAKKFLSNWSL